MESKNVCPKIKFYNGNEIPQIGFGVFQIKGDELTEKCVLEALKILISSYSNINILP